MINCPKCGGLNPQSSLVCGNCGANLESVNNLNNLNTMNNNTNNNDGIVLYEKEFFNNATDTSKVKNKQAGISIWHVILFIASILSVIFIPIRIVKLGLAFVMFYIAESSNRKNSIFLILTRIITAVEIWGFIIALILRVFVSIDAMNKFFEYFRF